MPKFLEQKLMAQYGPGSAVPYKIMNAIGAMNGPNETPRGAAMQRKHVADVKAGTASGQHPHRNLGKFLHPRKSR